MKDNNPVNNGLISSVFGSHRAASGTLDPNIIASGMIDKYGSSVTNARNVQTLMSETKSETNYKKKFASSFDSVFAPFSTKLDEGGIPSFGIPTNKSEPNSLTLNPYNPNNALSLAYAPTGSTLYLESLADSGNPTPEETGVRGSGVIANTWIESGHNIIWAHGGSGDRTFYNFDDEFTASTGNFVEVENVRAVGLKAPVVLTGWGFSVDGDPVPADTGDATKFAPNAFSDAGLHKTGPLDVRWDEERQVWGVALPKTYLVKMTNTYNPSHFSYEVQRSDSRSQYSRDTLSARGFSETAPIHDPESIAYDADDRNTGAFERLDYAGLQYPHYEAFIIRQTSDDVGNGYYNLFTDDCQDCGHVTKSGCGTQHGSDSKQKKILIENPLRQSMNVGDLAFTVKTGRKREVNTGNFTGGSGVSATAELQTDANGNMSGVVLTGGNGYAYGAFGIPDEADICTNIALSFNAGSLTGIVVTPSGGYEASATYGLSIYPNNSAVETESLDIHWILQAEFKSQQLITHVEADGGIMQTCSAIVQTQGFKSCEQCGEDLTLVNNIL